MEKKYNVHVYAVVRVKVENVTAESQKEAIKKAEESLDLHQIFDGGYWNAEYAEEIAYYLVDEVGDEEYENSCLYGADGKELDPFVAAGKIPPTKG